MSGFVNSDFVSPLRESADWADWGTSRLSLNVRNFLKVAGPRSKPYDYLQGHWPGTSGLLGAQGVDYGMINADWWDQPEITSGCASRYGVSGITRDAYGQPLGSVNVKLFYTGINTTILPPDTLVASTTSDPTTGYFFVTTPYYPDAHYLVTYKSGSPDVFATSPNTIIAG